MNAQSIMVMCNQRAAETLGYTVQEVIGKDVATILPPQIADMHPTFIRNYIATGAPDLAPLQPQHSPATLLCGPQGQRASRAVE